MNVQNAEPNTLGLYRIRTQDSVGNPVTIKEIAVDDDKLLNIVVNHQVMTLDQEDAKDLAALLDDYSLEGSIKPSLSSERFRLLITRALAGFGATFQDLHKWVSEVVEDLEEEDTNQEPERVCWVKNSDSAYLAELPSGIQMDVQLAGDQWDAWFVRDGNFYELDHYYPTSEDAKEAIMALATDILRDDLAVLEASLPAHG
ncbi:MAG: hypothetical protein AAF267_01380 [Deinococcota bacterium]